VRLLTAGRVFRAMGSIGTGEDATHLKVFHQADGLCVAKGADAQAMMDVVSNLLMTVLGLSKDALKWEPENYPLFEQASDLDVKLCGKWTSIAGGGVLPAGVLRNAGFDPDEVGCFAFGLGLERLAMLKFGVDDIRKLWLPPYIT
jgi:phenylalanyl-tRNA synthetase alpha chain